MHCFRGCFVCSCGRRITVRYTGNGGIYPIYECNWQRREGLSTTSCLSMRCDLLDGPIIARLLEAVEPKQIEIAIEAFEELERRQNVVDNQWRMKLERARMKWTLLREDMKMSIPRTASSRPPWSGGGMTPSLGPMRSDRNWMPTRRRNELP